MKRDEGRQIDIALGFLALAALLLAAVPALLVGDGIDAPSLTRSPYWL